jgi:hypothetical protein
MSTQTPPQKMLTGAQSIAEHLPQVIGTAPGDYYEVSPSGMSTSIAPAPKTIIAFASDTFQRCLKSPALEHALQVVQLNTVKTESNHRLDTEGDIERGWGALPRPRRQSHHRGGPSAQPRHPRRPVFLRRAGHQRQLQARHQVYRPRQASLGPRVQADVGAHKFFFCMSECCIFIFFKKELAEGKRLDRRCTYQTGPHCRQDYQRHTAPREVGTVRQCGHNRSAGEQVQHAVRPRRCVQLSEYDCA